jgi:hypothetical protein
VPGNRNLRWTSSGHTPSTGPGPARKVAPINGYHPRQFAAWTERLKAIKEGATLLDNPIIVYGAGLKETPMSNLFLTTMDHMEVHAEHFGDSTGRIEALDLA